MCFTAATPEERELDEMFKMKQLDIDFPRFPPIYAVSAFSHPQLLVMTADEPYKLQPQMWGFVPTWAKDREDARQQAKMYLNVTCEKIMTTYKQFRRNRCIIFLKGFYEWQWNDPAGKQKTPYFIYASDKMPLAVGGLYNSWRDPETGESYATCSIMTTPANALMAEIHNNKKRMPYILQGEDWSPWLDKGLDDEALVKLPRPLPEGKLSFHEVSKELSKRGRDINVPETQQPVAPGLTLL